MNINFKDSLDLGNKKIICLLQNLPFSQRLLALLKINKKNDKLLNYYYDLGYAGRRLMMGQSGHEEDPYVTAIDLNSAPFKPTRSGDSKVSKSKSKLRFMACSLIFIGGEDGQGN